MPSSKAHQSRKLSIEQLDPPVVYFALWEVSIAIKTSETLIT